MPKVSQEGGDGEDAQLSLRLCTLAPLLFGPSLSLGCFVLLTALHIYANYRAVRALVLETLNESRLQLVLKHFLQRGEVLKPASANQMEPLWTGDPTLWSLVLGFPCLLPLPEHPDCFQQVSGHPCLCPWAFPYTAWSPGKWSSISCFTHFSHKLLFSFTH